MRTISRFHRLFHQRGISLIELMLSITIGLLIVSGLSIIFVNSSRTNAETEKISQQIENGSYAARLLSDDLRLAGYYGELNPVAIAAPATKPNVCATSAADLTEAIVLPVQGIDESEAPPPACLRQNW